MCLCVCVCGVCDVVYVVGFSDVLFLYIACAPFLRSVFIKCKGK